MKNKGSVMQSCLFYKTNGTIQSGFLFALDETDGSDFWVFAKLFVLIYFSEICCVPIGAAIPKREGKNDGFSD